MKFKNLRFHPLLVHLIVTLIYPLFRALTAEKAQILVFTDALTIVGLVMIIGGIIYALYLHGDFDISSYLFRRGIQKEPKQPFRAFLFDVYEKREEAFNYPLFIGLLYVIVSALIACLIS